MLKQNFRWIMLLFLFLLTLVSYMDRANLSVAVPHIMKEFHLSATEIGVVLSGLTIGYTVLNFFGGFLADRFSPRLIITVCLALWSLFTVGTGLGWSFVSLFVIRILFGAAEGPLQPSNTKLVSNWMLPSERGLSSALWLSGGPLGTVVGAPVSGYIVEHWGWRSVFYVFGLGGLFLAALTFIVLRDKPSEHPWVHAEERSLLEKGLPLSSNAALETKQETWSHVFATPTIWVLALTYFCLAALFWANLGWLPTYFVKARGSSILSSGIYFAIPNICAALGALLAGRLSDRLFQSRRGPLLIIAFLITIPFVIIAVNASSLYISLGAFSVAAAANFACAALAWALPLNLFPEEQVAASSGLMLTCGSIAGVLAPIFMGIILDATGSFKWSYYVFAVLSLIGAAFAAWITKKEREKNFNIAYSR